MIYQPRNYQWLRQYDTNALQMVVQHGLETLKQIRASEIGRARAHKSTNEYMRTLHDIDYDSARARDDVRAACFRECAEVYKDWLWTESQSYK